MRMWTISIRRALKGEYQGPEQGEHKVTVKGATKDHDLVTAADSITVDVQ